MIWLHIPGFTSSAGGPRWGDCALLRNKFSGKLYDVLIDIYTAQGQRLAINRLKELGVKEPYIYISHAHGDHDEFIDLINDSYFAPRGLFCYGPDTLSSGLGNGEVKGDYNYLKKVIKAAKAKGIPVKYLKDGDKCVHGEIEFYVYREQPKFTGNGNDPHGWAFVNDGSLCFWFPALKYWTSGDGPDRIYDLCKKVGAKPAFFKIPHHGNACTQSQAYGLKADGSLYCWDNDYSTSITDFLSYGRRRCIEAGIKFFNIHGDINAVFYGGKCVIYKGGKYYEYKCRYKGKTELKMTTAAVVKNVLADKYGSSELRVTRLIHAGYYPNNTQRKVNAILDLEQAIKKGKRYTYEEVRKLIGKSFIPVLNGRLPADKRITEDQAPTTAPDLRDMRELFGVDVGYSQGKIDWDKAAKEIDFAIIELGYGQDRTNQDDSQFARNCAECERLGIPYGIYLYSYAKNTTAAAGEADHALRQAKGKQLSLPIYYDLEDKTIAHAAAGNMGVFGSKIERAGYWCGLYSGEYFYNTNLRGINRFTKWIARYNSNNGKPGAKPNVQDVVIWQYSSKGRVSGINGNVDVNIMYGYYLITKITGKDYVQAARDVWAGKRKAADYKALGYDVRIVQHFVNRMKR